MIDLHLHSTFSDGTYTPEQLVAEAGKLGLAAISLTDHDTTEGLPSFLAAGAAAGLRVLTGIEISAEHNGVRMHMLGYLIDPGASELNARLARMRKGRETRNLAILERLRALGLPIPLDEVLACAGKGTVGRPHIAQVLQAHGYVKSTQEAFTRYLARGRPAYVDRERFSVADSIRFIRRAGGLPVVAHPYILGLDPPALKNLLRELIGLGLAGLEVYYPEHDLPLQLAYLELARELDLVATGGSDFHGAVKPRLKMGRGFGPLRVPDEVVQQLLARRSAP